MNTTESDLTKKSEQNTELVKKAPNTNPMLTGVPQKVVNDVQTTLQSYVNNGTLHVPADYSPENALKNAWLILHEIKDSNKNAVLSSCSITSICNALLTMAIQGLDPAKKQCYFIAYGKTLACQRSYFGDMALVRRIEPGCNIYYAVIYKGDEFDYSIQRGLRKIESHKQKLENVKHDNIKGAYCVIEDKSGRIISSEIMTLERIEQSWSKSKVSTTKKDGTHQMYKDDMCLRTVIRKTCKIVINSSSDSLLMQHIRTAAQDEVDAEIAADADANANRTVIGGNAPPELMTTDQIAEHEVIEEGRNWDAESDADQHEGDARSSVAPSEPLVSEIVESEDDRLIREHNERQEQKPEAPF